MLTNEDVVLLLEALDAWECAVTGGAMFGGLLTSMFIADKEEAKAAVDAQMEEAKIKQRQRQRRAILLKAKLVQMQDDLAPDQLFSRVVCVEETNDNA